MLKRNFLCSCSYLFLVLGLLIAPAAKAAKHPVLPAKYDHWLHQDVNYLITDEERANFYSLTTNQERDAFMESFWAIRNPDPNAPGNSVREEHYRRLEYANSHFGVPSLDDGWRTDRGMVYITLGEPKQKQVYLNTKYLKQFEIWFYQDPGNALAPYFSVLFFKPSPVEDYRIYSPYQDRPEKLIASTNAVNDQPTAIKIIKEQLSDEVANLTLSLLPNEPVDAKEAYPGLESDTLLNKIRDYRNLPENKSLLAYRKGLLEGVTHRVLLGQDFSDLTALATRDGVNQASVHYLLRLLNPVDFILGKDSGRRVYYSLSVDANLHGPDGKIIYTDNQQLHEFLTTDQVEQLKNRPLAIEGRLAAVPGKYELTVDVTNLVTRQSFSQTRGVLVPGFDQPLGMSQVVFAATTSPQRTFGSPQPFSFSGVRVPVAGSDNATLAAGDPLRVIFQLWEQPDLPAMLKGKNLEISYLIGQLGVANRKEQPQTIDRGGFDAQGNLLMGTDLPTADMHPGNYRLVVKVTDPESSRSASQSINFRLTGGDHPPLFRITSPSYTTAADSATNLYRRGLCALAQQQPQAAVTLLKQAIDVGKPDAAMYSALASAYRLTGNAAAAVLIEKQRDSTLEPQGPAALAN